MSEEEMRKIIRDKEEGDEIFKEEKNNILMNAFYDKERHTEEKKQRQNKEWIRYLIKIGYNDM